MSHFYGIRDDTESIATIHHAQDRGLNFPDKADLYGPFTDELLIGQAMAERRRDAFIAAMFGMTRDPANPAARGSNDRPDYDKAATPDSSAGVSNKSICIACTVLTRPCRLKKPLTPWPNWTSLARCIRLPHCRLNIRCGRVIPESPARSPPAAKTAWPLLPVHRRAVVFSRVPSPNPKPCRKATIAGARHALQKKLPAI